MLELLSGNGLMAGLIAVVVALVGALAAVLRSNGKKSAEADELRRQRERDAEQNAAIRRSLEGRINADAETDRLPDGAALDELRRDWSRK